MYVEEELNIHYACKKIDNWCDCYFVWSEHNGCFYSVSQPMSHWTFFSLWTATHATEMLMCILLGKIETMLEILHCFLKNWIETFICLPECVCVTSIYLQMLNLVFSLVWIFWYFLHIEIFHLTDATIYAVISSLMN